MAVLKSHTSLIMESSKIIEKSVHFRLKITLHMLQGSPILTQRGAKLYHDYDYKLYATLEYLFMILSALNGKKSLPKIWRAKQIVIRRLQKLVYAEVVRIRQKYLLLTDCLWWLLEPELSPEYETISFIFHQVIVWHNSYFSSLGLFRQSFEFSMATPLIR